MKINKLDWFAIFVIIFAVFLAITSAWDDSVIVDEVPHIGAGYSYLTRQDMRLNPEHPPLAKDLAALPLVFLDFKQSVFEQKFWQTDINGQWEFGRYFMFNSDNDADTIKHWVKFPMLLFFTLSATLIYLWGKRLYGYLGAIIALVLFAFSPSVIAHARFVTTDVPALFGVLFALYFFIKYLRVPSGKNLFISGISLGVALLTKFSTFLVGPLFMILAIIYGWVMAGSQLTEKINAVARQFTRVMLVAIIGLVIVVWPVYYFHVHGYPVERQMDDTQFLLGSFGNRALADTVIWLADKPYLRALGQYFLGLLMVVQRSTGGNTTFFLGEVSAAGWRSYFPIVYFLKETLAWWILTLIAILMIGTQVKSSEFKAKSIADWIRNHFDEFAMIIWLVIYWTTSIKSNLNIGVRHLLPTFPFAILLVSGQISKLIKKVHEKAGQLNRATFVSVIVPTAVAILLSWHFYENAKVFPYYLSYFNQIAGGPAGGYRYVVDSNLDWGQDLLRLSRWVEANDIKRIEVDYFGWADPAYYLKDRFIWLTSTKYKNAADFLKRSDSDGWLAVSATFLQGSQGTPDDHNNVNYNNWLKAFEPITIIGNSIFVYNIK